MGGDEPDGPRPHPEACCRDHARAQPRALRTRDTRHRQADPGDDRRRSDVRCRQFRILRWRHRHGAQRRLHPARRRFCLYQARGPRRLRRYRRLELSAADRLLEGCASACRRQCHGLQAVGEHAARRAEDRRDPGRGRPAEGPLQRHPGRPHDRSAAGQPSRCRQGVADRLGPDGQEGGGCGGGRTQARHHGAWR
ncbi:hypothetical protein D9M70_507610 [compost metagenome]